MRLGKRYSPERLENACERAIRMNSYSYKSIESILKNGFDKVPMAMEEMPDTQAAHHANIRGKNYYQN
jgi:hypothetical protein